MRKNTINELLPMLGFQHRTVSHVVDSLHSAQSLTLSPAAPPTLDV